MTLDKTMRRGAVLIWAMITLAVVTTMLGVVGSYNATAMRLGRQYLAANGEYYSFLYAKGQITQGVADAIAAANGADEENALSTLVSAMKKLEKDYWDGDNHIVVKVQGFDTLASDLEKGSGKITVVATVYRPGAGGLEIVAKQFEKDINLSFGLDCGSGFAMHPIFNYVYFANNRGHLEWPGVGKIYVNGDIGSNDRFTINGATVNGYIWAHTEAKNVSAVELKGSPHIWPYPVYLRRVVKEYKSKTDTYYTQVRPTDPILSNGKMVPWAGGYQATGDHSEYISIGDDGTVTYTYKYEAFRPVMSSTVTVGYDPGNRPTAVAMPLPSDKAYYDKVWWNDTSTYLRDLASWLNLKWFSGRYASISTSTVPQKKALVSVDKYTTSVKQWAQGKGIDMTGQPSDAAIKEWEEKNTTYQNYQAAVADYESRLATWQKDKDKWLADLQSTMNEEGQILTSTTVHKSPIDETVTNIVSSTTDTVTMPNVSNAYQYREKCINFTNEHGRSLLICENRYRDTDNTYKNIVWSRNSYDRTLWVKSDIGMGLGEVDVDTVIRTETNAQLKVVLTRSLASIAISDGYSSSVYPFEKRSDSGANAGQGTDPYYEGEGAVVKEAERGSVILIGTADFPIKINGPTYIDGDVVIRGFVTGQGTIYAGRNIHIIGDITYLNPPHWPHSTPAMNEADPEAVRRSNQEKDSLTLVARGNIIVGNYTDSAWMTSCVPWMKKASIDSEYRSNVPCCNNYSDDEIGYAGFDRDYTALEAAAPDGNEKIVWDYAKDPYEVLKPSDAFDVDYWVVVNWTPYVCEKRKYHMVPHRRTAERHFYECKLGSEVIGGLMQQTTSTKVTTAPWFWSSSVIMNFLFRNILGGRLMMGNVSPENITYDVSQASSAVAGDANAGDIVQIDAALFANHGVFGRVGGSASHKFKLHGALICRDEGLLPSFIDRFGNSSGAAAWVNWDMRIKSDSAEGLVGTGGPTVDVRHLYKTETSWRQTK